MEGVCSRAANCALSEGRGITVLLTEALRPCARSQGVTVRPAYDSQPLASAEDGREHREVHDRQDCACRQGDHPRGEDAADDTQVERRDPARHAEDRKSTRLNSSHVKISYAVFCLKKK